MPRFLKHIYAYSVGFSFEFLMLLKYTEKLKPMVVLAPFFSYQQNRGMSKLSNMLDWYGGFPYEFATYGYLVEYIQNRGFKLQIGKIAPSLGCHQLVFKMVVTNS